MKSQPAPHDQVHHLRGGGWLRQMNRLVPLGRKYHPLLSMANSRHGLLAVPFGKWHVLQPAAWGKQITTLLLSGTNFIPEFSLLAPICERLTHGSLIDVGANIGLYTLMLRAHSKLPIISYEPQPFLFKLLRWNIEYNQLQDVEPRNLACGSQRGEVPFSIGINGAVISDKHPAASDPSSKSAETWEAEELATREGGVMQRVPLVTLDEDLAGVPDIALLKIDCEGFECEILAGAQKLIAKHRPILFVEGHPPLLGLYGRKLEDVLELLKPHPYDFEFWYFQLEPLGSKFKQSLAKFRRPKARRCADASEMLALCKADPRPPLVYIVGRPKG